MIDKIIKNNLCLGCGLCSTLLGIDKCEMALNKKGFYEPIVKQNLSRTERRTISRTCPSIYLHAPKETSIWGRILSAYESWSSDKQIRFKASSGGTVTSLAIYLIQTKKVDAILHVGTVEGSYLYNKLQISRTTQEIIDRAKSRYAPALIFDNLLNILDFSNEVFAFIGKPCDIVGIKNFLNLYPKYKDRIKYFISIFCAGIPSYNSTIDLCKLSGNSEEPINIKYRGDGWPGEFKATFSNKTEFKLSYQESWGKYLGRNVCYRCKVCPDGIGLLADLSVGDSWNTKNGYPDFSENDGKCFTLIRTSNGEELLKGAFEANYLNVKPIKLDSIKDVQPYQYDRRKIVGWKLLPIYIKSGFLFNFKGLSLTKMSLSVNPKIGFMIMLGSIKRL